MEPLRIAVVGAGPAGIFSVEALTERAELPVCIDVFDRLPTPFGLVRYGVAPDHLPIRSVRESLATVLGRSGVRFIGNVDIGREVSVPLLRDRYHAVIYAYGAAGDRLLNIPGEGLDGSMAATKFVGWYCGHPDIDTESVATCVRSTRQVAIVGVGNVAVDVARVLAKTPGELEHTDMPAHVLEALGAGTITDIHIIGRRSPAHATFTTKELRELGELSDADVIIRQSDLALDARSQTALATNRVAARNLDVLRAWAERRPGGRRRRIHFRFLERPSLMVGPDRVRGLLIERTAIDGAGQVLGTGATESLEVQMVIRAAGYRGWALPGLPFEMATGTIPNRAGRVLRDGNISIGEYVTGWIKRGPLGVIGSNKLDAAETAGALLADVTMLMAAKNRSMEPGLDSMLEGKNPRIVSLSHWKLIDAAERALGEIKGKARTTIHQYSALHDACWTGLECPGAPLRHQ